MRTPPHPTLASGNILACLVLLLLAVLLLVSPAAAQVRNAPAGNSLPTPISPHAAEDLAELDAAPDAHVGHNHAHDHVHDHGSTLSDAEHAAFARKVDLTAFRKLAVFDNGRVKILDTLAQEQISRIFGKTHWVDAETGIKYDPVFTYLDLAFNRNYYYDKPLIYIEVLPLRRELVANLPADEQELWLRRGRLSPELLAQPHAQTILSGQASDQRLFKALQSVWVAASAYNQVGQHLAMVSPPPGSEHWAPLFNVGDARVASTEALPPGVKPTAITNAAAAQMVGDAVQQLAVAWQGADAEAVNRALAVLVDAIPQLNPQSYPSPVRLNLERLYNVTHRFTIGYVAYLVGAVVLLLAFAVRRRWLITTGVALLVAGFLVHSAGMVVRSVLSGRWPIHNQFESFIAITWFAVLVGMALMVARRQWLFGAAAAALGGCALLVANTYDIPSNEVGQVAAILATSRILYVHVNMVLFSYALIGLGFFISLFYLGMHYTQGRGAVQMAAAGLGAVNLDDDDATPLRGRQALLNDLDKAQMVVLQLAFWLLGFGILLGAYWADHSWGRWWAWDPKETWALITWIIYLITIHVRFGVRNRGLTTAWLSVLGFVVMLWTYWGVNMLLAGLHSYA